MTLLVCIGSKGIASTSVVIVYTVETRLPFCVLISYIRCSWEWVPVHICVTNKLFSPLVAVLFIYLWEKAEVFHLLCLWGSFPSTCERTSTQMCVEVTRRRLFPLMCITLTHFGSRKGKKRVRCGTRCWRSLQGVPVKYTQAQKHTHAHTDSCRVPIPCRFDDAREASQHGGHH